MALISPYVDRDEQGGVFRDTIHIRPIGVYAGGTLLSMNQRWVDGDANLPQIVTRAPLRVRMRHNGLRRFYPIPGDDSKYIEIGVPYTRVGGSWVPVEIGAPTRSEHKLVWQTTDADYVIQHGGHYCKLEIKLKNGYVPDNSQIAFPINTPGLIRFGTDILDNGRTVAHLKPFVVYDAANPLDVRPISHVFVNLNERLFLLLTLPDLLGMSEPVIDPTISLQPDASTGLDTHISNQNATTNFDGSGEINVGSLSFFTASIYRALIKFDLSTLPSGATLSSSLLSLYLTTNFANNSRVLGVYRQKKAWIETQTTWSIWSTGNNWTTAGGFDPADCEQTDIGFVTLASNATVSQFYDISLTPTTKPGLDLGNGWLLAMSTENADAHFFVASDGSTALQRPKLNLTYTLAGGGFPYQSRPFYVWKRWR